MGLWGGIFNLEYYLRPAFDSDETGTLNRYINCYDQAAILQLSCSFTNGPPTSWLAQQPFGFIKDTSLVGVVDRANAYITNINNPFFGTDISKANVSNNDPIRTWFGNHAYVGATKPFDPVNTSILDACAGPHTGTEKPAAYIDNSIEPAGLGDGQTNLYTYRGTYPGTVGNIMQGDGVTGINSVSNGSPSSRVTTISSTSILGQLVDGAVERSSTAVTHADWARADVWAPELLGADWTAAFTQLAANDGSARAFWHLEHPGGSPLLISVIVESVRAEGSGQIDLPRSKEAARACVEELLLSTDRDPEEVWACGELDEFGDYSLQNAPGIAAGRVVVAAANTVVDIAGLESTAALLPLARQLLEHVVRRSDPLLSVPTLHAGRTFITPSSEDVGEGEGTGDRTSVFDSAVANRVIVTGIHTRFTLEFDIDSAVCAARVDGPHVFFDRYEADEHTLRVFAVTRELGTHPIHIYVARADTMACLTHDLELCVQSSASESDEGGKLEDSNSQDLGDTGTDA